MKITTMSSGEVNLENGTYEGELSGYVVQVTLRKSELNPELSLGLNHKITKEFGTVQGVRGRTNVTVVVQDGFAVVSNDIRAEEIAAGLIRLHAVTK